MLKEETRPVDRLVQTLESTRRAQAERIAALEAGQKDLRGALTRIREANERNAQRERIADLERQLAELRTTLTHFAAQHLSEEIDDTQQEWADYKGAYDLMVRKARTILSTLEGPA
jgi:DNA repair exonuclease SbcCD ATPase subunit